MFSTFNKRTLLVLTIALPLCGMWLIGQGTYIHAKAILAQVLLETAWAESLKGQKEVKPWPWADTWPVSRLFVPRLGISRIVLAGASGSSLAFGPGHLFGSALPGQAGNSVIAGHRDTHFRFLQDLNPDDMITVQTMNSTVQHYRIIETTIINEADIQYLTETHDSTLTLITCFPFDAIVPGGSLRFIVIAKLNNTDSEISI
ncbi:MAG: class GN sortase [Gammaproteobacteria bacterium]